MKDIKYEEIYYTSSEGSIITHSAGFGIRTITNGMNVQEASTIAEKCVLGYSLDDNRKLTFEQIQNNPRIVYDYSPTYIYHKVSTESGSVKFVFGRTIYLGIDYGYFCNRNEAMRTGTNYFSHLIVFDEMPPVAILAEIERKDFFAPFDYTCSPNNEEIKALLTGEPQFLPPKSIQCETNYDFNIDPDFAYCVVGILQSYFNTKNNKEESLRKIIIKAPAALTPVFIKKFAFLPQELIGRMSFLTNYSQGYGVPDEFDMVFVNEYNKYELYENNHICIDLFTKSTTNVDDNYITKKIVELSAKGDTLTILQLINYYLDLDLTKDLNYPFLYNLFIAIEADKDICLQDISKEFVEQLNNVHLSSIQETKLWEKINSAINGGLSSEEISEINRAISVVGYILPANKRNLKITQESSTWITNIIFGEYPFLSKIVNSDNVDTVIILIDRTKILSENAFYNALTLSQEPRIWTKLIRFYYSNNLNSNIESVVDKILTSELSKQDKENLVNQFYPVGKCQKELLTYFLSHTNHITELIEIVKSICMNSREERFSALLRNSNFDSRIILALSPIVLSYYEKLLDDGTNSGMKSLLAFIDEVSSDVFNMMGISELFDKYIRISMNNPTKETKNILSRLQSSGIKMDGETSDLIVTLNNLFDNVIPKRVDVNILLTAHKMGKSADYIRDLYGLWLETQPTSKEIKEYIKSVDHLSSDVIEKIIMLTWESRIPMIRSNRKDYVLIISDNSKWADRDKKTFLKSCENKDLVRHLYDSNKIMKKVIRKILNLIK